MERNANRTYLCCNCKTTKRLQAWILEWDETLCPICRQKMEYLGTAVRIPKNTPKNWKKFAKWLSRFESEHCRKIVAKLKRG